jgi:hypothetical protein
MRTERSEHADRRPTELPMSRPYVRIATTVLAGLAFAAGALVVAPTASAPDLPRPTVSQTTVHANERFTVYGTGCEADPGGCRPA